MKAIIEFDAPESCAVCPLRFGVVCAITKYELSLRGATNRETSCPLKINDIPPSDA